MELNLTFERFLTLMNWDRETVLNERKAYKARGIPVKSVNAVSDKLKSEFPKLFGVTWDEVKENIDQRNWKKNIKRFWKGDDVDFALKASPAKRKRKSANDSLNESLLMNFEESTSLDDVDELSKLRAENTILRETCQAMQDLFVKKRKQSPRSRNSGGSNACYSNQMKSMAISLLAQGESSMSVYRTLKTMTLTIPELLEAPNEVVGIPCHQTLSRWRDQIPMLNTIQTNAFIQNGSRFVLGELIVVSFRYIY